MTIDEAIKNHKKLKNFAKEYDDKGGAFYSAKEHEQLVEWLEDYKRIKQWKSDIMDSFCKYDVSSFEELVTNVRNKTIDDFVKLVKKHSWNIRNRNEDAFIYGAIDRLAEQLKEHNK